MTRKDSQVLIFNKERILIALTTSTRSAALLTGVNENDVKLCCENQSSDSGQYCFRYNVESSIADDTLGKLTIDEYDKLYDYK
jgi:hypothetical protein